MESFFHLTGNWAYVFILLLVVSSPFAMVTRWSHWGHYAWLGEALIFSFPLVAMIVFFDHTRHGSGERWFHRFLQVPLLIAVGVGVALNNALAVLEGFSRKQTPFVRTPKQGDADRKARFYPSSIEFTSWLEGALAAYFLVVIFLLVRERMWGALPFLLLFGLGYTYITFLTLRSNHFFRKSQATKGGA